MTKDEYIKFITDLANGIDPKTKESISEDSVLNRIDIIRVLFSIKGYLEDNPRRTIPFKLTNLDVITVNNVVISNFVKKLNEMNCTNNMKKAYVKPIVDWLVKENYLCVSLDNKKQPTEKGEEIGISYTLKTTYDGKVYPYTEYNEVAQRFILDNILNGNIIF